MIHLAVALAQIPRVVAAVIATRIPLAALVIAMAAIAAMMTMIVMARRRHPRHQARKVTTSLQLPP